MKKLTAYGAGGEDDGEHRPTLKYARFKKAWLRDGIHAAAAPPQLRMLP